MPRFSSLRRYALPLLAAACVVGYTATTYAAASSADLSWESAAVPSSSVTLEDASAWLPAELEKLNAAHSSQVFSAMTDRELFDMQASMSGASSSSGTNSGASEGETPVNPPGEATQPNGLPLGVVRCAMQISLSIQVMIDAAFKQQCTNDLSSVLSITTERINQLTQTAVGLAVTVVFDFLAPKGSMGGSGRRLLADSNDQLSSLQLYKQLVATDPNSAAVLQTTYLKNVDFATITMMCDDGEFRHDCDPASSSDAAAAWVLPVIIASCAFFLICCVASIVFACIKCRRRRAQKSAAAAQALAAGASVEPAKKFVYTAPNREAGPEESISDITIHPQGEEFEPSTRTGSENSQIEVSKNRLSAKFPSKVVSNNGPEESASSHHFYYVDDSKNGGSALGAMGHENSTTSRRLSKKSVFTVESSKSRETSQSASQSLSAQSLASRTSVPSSVRSDETGADVVPQTPHSSTGSGSSSRSGSAPSSRKNSIDEGLPAVQVTGTGATSSPSTEKTFEKEKAPLPVLRPSKSPKQQQQTQ